MIGIYLHPLSLWGLGFLLPGLLIVIFYPKTRLEPYSLGCLALPILPLIAVALPMLLSWQQGEVGTFRAVLRLSVLPLLLFFFLMGTGLPGTHTLSQFNPARFSRYRPARPVTRWRPQVALEEPVHVTALRVMGLMLALGGAVSFEYGRHLLAREQVTRLVTPNIELKLLGQDGSLVALAPAPGELRPGELACSTALHTPRPSLTVVRPAEPEMTLKVEPYRPNAVASQAGVAARSWVCYRYARTPQRRQVTGEDWQKWVSRARSERARTED